MLLKKKKLNKKSLHMTLKDHVCSHLSDGPSTHWPVWSSECWDFLFFFVKSPKKKIPLLRLGSIRGQLSAKANAIPPHIQPHHRWTHPAFVHKDLTYWYINNNNSKKKKMVLKCILMFVNYLSHGCKFALSRILWVKVLVCCVLVLFCFFFLFPLISKCVRRCTGSINAVWAWIMVIYLSCKYYN